jgi:putative methanogenesis marker protein 1
MFYSKRDETIPFSRRLPMPAIILKECPKAYILETHRSRTPDDTLKFVETMKETIGMKNFSEVTDLDRIGIPVFTCHRIRPDDSLTDHTGKGLSKIQAQVSLSMESAERYASEFKPAYAKDLILGSYSTLSKRYSVLNPEELILPQFSRYTHDRELHWTWGFDLANDNEVLVPSCAVFHPFHIDDPPLINTHTNGIAAGNTIEEAVSHALAEVIERDAWSITKFTEDAGDALIVDDHPDNRFIVDVIEKFSKAEIEIVAKDITTDIGVPVIAAFSNDLVCKKLIPIDGFGAHLDPRVALIRSLLEIATTRGLFIQKFGIENWKLSYFDDSNVTTGDDDYRFCAYGQKYLHDLNADYSDDILLDVKTMIGKLNARGFRKVIAVNLTRREIGIPTVRMIVPGMEVYCFDNSRRGGRLYDALEERG